MAKILDFLFGEVTEAEQVEAVGSGKSYYVAGGKLGSLYFKRLAFKIAVSYIADTISKCEFKTYEKNAEVKNELYYLLNVSPNANESANFFKNKFVNQMFKTGEALVVQHGGNLYCADGFSVEYKPLEQNKYTNVSVDGETVQGEFLEKDVFHFRLTDDELIRLINGMANDYEELLKVAFDSYKKAKGEKYKLKLDNIQQGDEEFAKEFDEIIKKSLEGFIKDYNGVYVEFDGQTLEQMKTSNDGANSSDIRDIKKDMFETVAQAFKMPVSMLYGNMTNVKDIVNAYITFTLEPIVRMIGNEITRKNKTFDEWSNGDYVKVDISSIYYLDVFDISEHADKLIASGTFCIDEVREKMGENLLNTEFSKTHFITKNYATSEQALTNLEGKEENANEKILLNE